MIIAPHGATAPLLEALLRKSFELILSEHLLLEFLQTMRYPRIQRFGPFSEASLQRATGILRRLASVVPGQFLDLDAVPTDLKDNQVVACALEGSADFIVTDDRRDLLPLKVVRFPGFRPIQIVSLGAFLDRLASLGEGASRGR